MLLQNVATFHVIAFALLPEQSFLKAITAKMLPER
jgi:hypothetical protein